MALLAEYSSEELFQAQLQLWLQAVCFFKPVALSAVLDLLYTLDHLGVDPVGVYLCFS